MDMIVRGDIWDLAREDGVHTELQLKVLELRELHGCTWNQIAYMMNLEQSTPRGHYQRAQRRLFNELEKRNQEATA
jgi:DNA-directed RNA polymerase specialized sigma24 family protein